MLTRHYPSLVRLIGALVLVCGLVCTPVMVEAGQKTVHVKEYTRKDGTHVAAHERKAPNTAGTPTTTTTSTPAETPAHEATPALGIVARDERGRIQRSAAARHAFARSTGYFNGRPGYVIDHIVPLACGGADAPSNMQWQSVAEGKAKDKWERSSCGATSAYRAPAQRTAPAGSAPPPYGAGEYSQFFGVPSGTGAARLVTGGAATELHAQDPGQSLMTAALRLQVTALEQELARLQRDYQVLLTTCSSQPSAPR